MIAALAFAPFALCGLLPILGHWWIVARDFYLRIPEDFGHV